MKTIRWMRTLSIDNGTLDYEHKMAIFIVNRFIEMGRHFTSMDHAIEFLEILLLLSQHHFTHEEQFMQEVGYPLLKEHRHKHRVMLDGLRQVIANVERAGPSELPQTAKETATYLKYWLTRHILADDLAIKAFIQEGKSRDAFSPDAGYVFVK